MTPFLSIAARTTIHRARPAAPAECGAAGWARAASIAGCRLFRRSSRRNRRAQRMEARAELVLLLLDEFAVVRRIEIEQRPARREMLDENLADQICGARGERRHD